LGELAQGLVRRAGSGGHCGGGVAHLRRFRPVSASDQLALTLGPSFTVEVDDRFSPGLTGRHDRAYASPPQLRDAALTLAALLLDAGADLDGVGPWQRALAGGRRTVRLVPAAD
jgi:hypothetical protein